MGDDIRRIPLNKKYPANGKRMNGKPSLLSAELQLEFVEYVLRGLPPPRSCDMVGISERTYHLWMLKGRQYSEDLIEGEQNDIHDKYYEFYRQVNRAVAQWQLRFVDRLSQNVVDTTWTRDLAVLERRDSKNWGRDADHTYRGRDDFPSDESFL